MSAEVQGVTSLEFFEPVEAQVAGERPAKENYSDEYRFIVQKDYEQEWPVATPDPLVY